MTILLGCIADDFTGGTDVAAALRRSGLTVTLLFGEPGDGAATPTTDAVVIALKTRTVPAAEAVRESVACLAWLENHDVDRVYFKYCSTFDSTDDGNIGPVTDALLHALGEDSTLICPASPEHGRTMFEGHLFVGADLLSESSMRHHPLTPMTDPRIDRVLSRQTPGQVAVLPLSKVLDGEAATAERLAGLVRDGVRHVVTDAVTDAHLRTIAAAATDLRLLTGGAGLAGAWGHLLATVSDSEPSGSNLRGGPTLVLAGSCSATTLQQVALATEAMPSFRLDPASAPDPDELYAGARRWLHDNWSEAPLLVYSSAGPEGRAAGLAAMGPRTPELLEDILGRLAREAAELGAGRFVVAGGETSGAVVRALEVSAVEVHAEADRGVPWCTALDTHRAGLALLLKSGNFGQPDLLVRAPFEETA